jgi:hypothetical protein
MKTAELRKSGKSSIDLVEEAMQVLRSASLESYAVYYAGAIPFVIGVLYFWTVMSQNPSAGSNLTEMSLVVAVLFIWMRCCQAMFARRIRSQVSMLPNPPLRFRQYMGVFVRQLIIQPSGLFLMPAALALVAPFGWVFAFYQSVLALDDGTAISVSELLRKARKQTMLWPMQNHLALLMILGLALFVFLDLTILTIAVPSLIKLFLGIETTFSRSALAMLNSTMFAAVAAMTYLCIDPLLKAVFVLRCHYGMSIESGEDLKAALRHVSATSKGVAVAGLLSLLLICSIPLHAQPTAESAASPTSSAVSETELNHHIDQVLEQRKFSWRMPQEDNDSEKKQSFIGRFLQKVAETISRWAGILLDWIDDLLRRLFSQGLRTAGDHRFQWVTSSLLLYVLLGTVIVALIIYLIHLHRKKKAPAPVTLEAIPVAVDITDEAVRADQLPEDRWTALGQELLTKGEWRLAMRAFYLASLANLAQRHLIGIASFKSNREYENELRRRAHSLPDLVPAFGRNVSIFERVWYGTHSVNDELLQEFSANIQIIRGGS